MLFPILGVAFFKKNRIAPWLARVVAPHRLKRLLIWIFPALLYKLPARGGIRYYVDTSKDPLVWQGEVVQAMRTARMIVVLLGTTDSLTWEMEQIRSLNLLEKTVFLIPPVFKKKKRVRWRQFIDYLNDDGAFDTKPLEKVKFQHVLAVCVHQDVLLIVKGKRGFQTLYESALDIATLFTVADRAYSRSMISKYLT